MGGLSGADTIAEKAELGGSREARDRSHPAFAETHHPFDALGGEASGSGLGGGRCKVSGDALPATDGRQVLAPPAGRRVTAVRRFMPPCRFGVVPAPPFASAEVGVGSSRSLTGVVRVAAVEARVDAPLL